MAFQEMVLALALTAVLVSARKGSKPPMFSRHANPPASEESDQLLAVSSSGGTENLVLPTRRQLQDLEMGEMGFRESFSPISPADQQIIDAATTTFQDYRIVRGGKYVVLTLAKSGYVLASLAFTATTLFQHVETGKTWQESLHWGALGFCVCTIASETGAWMVSKYNLDPVAVRAADKEIAQAQANALVWQQLDALREQTRTLWAELRIVKQLTARDAEERLRDLQSRMDRLDAYMVTFQGNEAPPPNVFSQNRTRTSGLPNEALSRATSRQALPAAASSSSTGNRNMSTPQRRTPVWRMWQPRS